MSSPKNALSGASLALAALLCAALPARAGDRTVLRPMLDVEQNWDSNILNQNNSGDIEGGLVTRVSPALWIENTGELGHARLGLTAVAREVWRESNLSGIDGLAHGDFERKLTPRLSVFGNGLLDHYSGYDAIGDTGPGNQGGQPILAQQPAWNRDQIEGGFSYFFTERLSARLSGSAGRINYESINTGPSTEGYYRDRSLYGAQSALLYQLTALDQVSAGVDLDDTSYQNLGFGTNDSDIWSAYLGWARSWTQAWSTKATLGFRVLDTTQKDVPQQGTLSNFFPVPLPAKSFSNSGTGLIGSLSILRAFARGSIELSYDRDTRSTGGAGKTNFNIDSFTLAWTQRLAERVRLKLSGNYSLYDSVTNEAPNYRPQDTSVGPCPSGGVPTPISEFLPGIPVFQCVGGSATEKREYTTLVGRIEWQMRRTLSAYVVARYYKSLTDQTFGSRDVTSEDLDKYMFGAGFRYFWDFGL